MRRAIVFILFATICLSACINNSSDNTISASQTYNEKTKTEYHSTVSVSGNNIAQTQPVEHEFSQSIFDIQIEKNTDSNIYAYSSFSDDYLCAVYSPQNQKLYEDDPEYDEAIMDIYCNDIMIAQTVLADSTACDMQWINEETALLMHIYIYNIKDKTITAINGNEHIAKVISLYSFVDSSSQELATYMSGDKTLLNSCVDSLNNCIYYAFSDNYDYDIYRYDLSTKEWDILFHESQSLSEFSWQGLYSNGNFLLCGNLNGCYKIDLTSGIVSRMHAGCVIAISPDFKHCIIDVMDEKTGGGKQYLFSIEQIEIICELGDYFPYNAVWLNNDMLAYTSESGIYIYSIKQDETAYYDIGENLYSLSYEGNVLFYKAY